MRERGSEPELQRVIFSSMKHQHKMRYISQIYRFVVAVLSIYRCSSSSSFSFGRWLRVFFFNCGSAVCFIDLSSANRSVHVCTSPVCVVGRCICLLFKCFLFSCSMLWQISQYSFCCLSIFSVFFGTVFEIEIRLMEVPQSYIPSFRFCALFLRLIFLCTLYALPFVFIPFPLLLLLSIAKENT